MARFRFGRGQPPDDLDQQAAGQFVVVEAGRSDVNPVAPGLTADSADSAGTDAPADTADPRLIRYVRLPRTSRSINPERSIPDSSCANATLDPG
jgi:hypothetical protein